MKRMDKKMLTSLFILISLLTLHSVSHAKEAESYAVVITDPQNDFLSPQGVAWPLVKESVKENGTVEHIEAILKEATAKRVPIFVSPHFYYPYDQEWEFTGKMEEWMHEHEMYMRKGPLTLEGFENSGADFLERYKPYIYHENTAIVSPHKVYGPENNDLVLQLRKKKINHVFLIGMSANLCVESHMRELIEQGFNVTVVSDATAAAKMDGLDGYQAALTNFKMIANDVITTKEMIKKLHSK